MKRRASTAEVRAGIQQAELGQTGLNVVALEALAIGVVAGGLSGSWAVGIAVCFVVVLLLLVMAMTKKLRTPAIIVLGALWGLGAAALGLNTGGNVFLVLFIALMVGVAGAGANMAAFEHMRDLDPNPGAAGGEDE